ncbi:MAG TPA: MltA domain-containing protein [Burkholderiaceae bacterium]|nr:MltA domain-containing protein [Burkholderiaceae bacterium]
MKPPPVAAPIETRALYEPVVFEMLPGTRPEDWLSAWPAFLQTCRALGKRDAWRDACGAAEQVDVRDAAAIRSYFSTRFDAYRVLARRFEGEREIDTRDSGLATGYYEPLLRGSRARSERYATPIYRVPPDLLVIDLGAVHPELANLRLRGKLQGRRVVPYPSRGEIAAGDLLAGQELLWVDDPVDAFFLQIQGSGRVQFDDGNMVRLGYGDQNGHPYRSIGRWLVDQGQMTLDETSMAGIKSWIARNPGRAQELLDQNPSFVFFRELPLGDPAAGPIGALGVPLTAGASVAADPRHIPLGAPLVVSTTDPASGNPLIRPMVAQDTGGAIRGPLRFDFFWGFGAEAGQIAGRQKYDANAWLLVPKGAPPESLLRR